MHVMMYFFFMKTFVFPRVNCLDFFVSVVFYIVMTNFFHALTGLTDAYQHLFCGSFPPVILCPPRQHMSW